MWGITEGFGWLARIVTTKLQELGVTPQITKGFMWTGFQTMKNRDGLIDACCQARENAHFAPVDGTTYCNLAVAFIASKMGCNELAGLLANDMVDYFTAKPDNWSLVPLDKAQALASQGSLVIASEKGEPHGHVCVVMPGITKTSGHWNAQAPACVNIGKTVFIGKGLNYAFQTIPFLYVWRPSL